MRDWLRARRSWRIVSTLLCGAVVAASSYYIGRTFVTSLAETSSSGLALRPGPLVLSLIITVTCVVLGSLVWRGVLLGLGAEADRRSILACHLAANMGRYLPGPALRHVGVAYLTHQRGVTLRTASAAVLVEFAIIAAVRLALALTLLSPDDLVRFGAIVPMRILWVARAIAWGGLAALPMLVGWLARRPVGQLSPATGGVSVRLRRLWQAISLTVLANALYGVGFVLLVGALFPLRLDQALSAFVASMVSWLVSLLAFFVPGGITVREGVIVLALDGVLPGAAAAVLAIASRGVLVLAELLGAVVGLVLLKRSLPDASPNG